MDNIEIAYRKEIARQLITSKISELDMMEEIDDALLAEKATLMAVSASLNYPDGLGPIPQTITPKPDIEAPLPKADILVVTWTIDEQEALAEILTPGIDRNKWHRYRRNFDSHFDAIIRKGNVTRQPPSRTANRLGSWYMIKIGDRKVICFKSELHLNQDGILLDKDRNPSETKQGYASLPVKDLFKQLIEEVKPSHVITVGTAGGVFKEHGLGDVVVTRGAKFRLQDEFKNESFNAFDNHGAQYKSQWTVPTTHFEKAEELMGTFKKNLVEPDFTTPTVRYNNIPTSIKSWPNDAKIRLDGTNELPAFHPIVTTDFFEFGTSDNGMDKVGAAMEMGDAVLGLVCQEMQHPPKWLVIRNLSDPQINGALSTKPSILNMQTHWAVWYYEKYGYWTSVNSALTTWAVIAGL
jgi:nucleoside phosphorylase